MESDPTPEPVPPKPYDPKDNPGAPGDTNEEEDAEKLQQVETRLKGAILLAATELEVTQPELLAAIGDPKECYMSHMQTGNDLKDVVKAVYVGSKINHGISLIAAEANLDPNYVHSVIKWDVLYRKWVEGGKTEDLYAVMKDRFHKKLAYLKKQEDEVKTTKQQPKKAGSAVEEDRAAAFKAKPSSDAKDKRDSVLEQRQREAREKTLQKKRGMIAQEVQSQEEIVMTDNEEDLGYGESVGE